MKVVISTRAVYPFHRYGGMEKYFYYLSKHLVEQGIEVEIVTSIDGTGRKNAEHDGIKYIFLQPNFYKRCILNPLHYYSFYLNVAYYLRKAEFDILHGCSGVHGYLLFRERKPVIVQPFGIEPFKSQGLLRVCGFITFYYPTKFVFKHADAIASLGEANTQEIISLFKVPREKIFTLPNGIDLSLVEEYLANTKITRENYGIQDADLVLINVNKLTPHKGVNYLIDALQILNKILNTKLILIGSGSQEQKIKEQIRELGLEDKIIHFKNIPDDKMFQLYALADISVTPTLYEGGCPPFVVLEAMACGKPIVASDIPFMHDAVKDGENGFLFPPGDSEAIANAVLKIYDKNLFDKMGSGSKETVRDYEWSNIAKMAIRKYEELIGK